MEWLLTGVGAAVAHAVVILVNEARLRRKLRGRHPVPGDYYFWRRRSGIGRGRPSLRIHVSGVSVSAFGPADRVPRWQVHASSLQVRYRPPSLGRGPATVVMSGWPEPGTYVVTTLPAIASAGFTTDEQQLNAEQVRRLLSQLQLLGARVEGL